eukprot:CAMPEP_0116150656 /NCGR_PEP_ID=MMETSP0329-20121206/19668_1 /TAXON_ID=697910 /ORGANISM="Pseudo-nitzschia arenysensis, Strain B593" /LENGTH=282 /DNA_ID=CAMNT_0003647193 /DNA_START=268 /DNA_END=1116 /DNA_ORIENTATION=+
MSMKKKAALAVVSCLLSVVPTNGFSFRERNYRNPWRSTKFTTRLFSSEEINMRECDSDQVSNANDEYDISRRSTIRGAVPAAVLIASTVVSDPKAAHAAIDVSGLRVEGTPKPSSPPPPAPSSSSGVIELAGIQYTSAAMILQMAEQTASMEGMMKASASEIMAKKSRQERIEGGSKGTGPGVVTRGDLTQSVGIMVKNSKIATLAPQAAITLQGIPEYLSTKSPTTDMSFDEYLTVAKKYEQAREDLRVVFEKMSEQDQMEGKQIVRAIRKRDMERMAEMP